jgi:hypothetical protein
MSFFFVLITSLVSATGYFIGKHFYERKAEYEKLKNADRLRQKVEIAALKGEKVPDYDDDENMKNTYDNKKLLIELETKFISNDLKANLLQ